MNGAKSEFSNGPASSHRGARRRRRRCERRHRRLSRAHRGDDRRVLRRRLCGPPHLRATQAQGRRSASRWFSGAGVAGGCACLARLRPGARRRATDLGGEFQGDVIADDGKLRRQGRAPRRANNLYGISLLHLLRCGAVRRRYRPGGPRLGRWQALRSLETQCADLSRDGDAKSRRADPRHARGARIRFWGAGLSRSRLYRL